MIQRIQTIWLFLIAVLSALLLFTPIVGKLSVSPYDLLFTIGNGLVAVLALITVFLYKKRPLQIKLCYGIYVLLMLSFAAVFIDGHIAGQEKTTYIAMSSIMLALIFGVLAIRAIKKDEDLVRSLNRLR